MLYQTPVLKLMNGLVFADSFILIFIGMGVKGGQDIGFSAVYGMLGGLIAALMFNVVVLALIMLSSRKKRSQAKARIHAGNDTWARAKI